MAISFPTDLDIIQNPVATDNTVTVPHATQHANANDAIEALEAKVGKNSSAVTTSHDYKLSEILTTDKAVGKTAEQTLTQKTLTSPKINLGSDATGDIYYRHSDGTLKRLAIGTANYILNVNSGVPTWREETSVADASVTAKGIVEEATLAEIDAGTGAGGTSARLFVNPSTLGKSVDTTMADNSDAKIPSQHAVKTYVDSLDTKTSYYGKVETITSANLKQSANTERDVFSYGSYTKVKEIVLAHKGQVRVDFTIHTVGAGSMYARVYRNGVAVGTEIHTGTGGGYDVKTENISGWAKDDLIQLYAYRGDVATAATVKDFKVYYDFQLSQTTYPLPTVNTD